MARREKFTPQRIGLLAFCLLGLALCSTALFLLVRSNGMMEYPPTTIGSIVGTLAVLLGLNWVTRRRAVTPKAKREARVKTFLICFIGGWILLICIAAGLSQ